MKKVGILWLLSVLLLNSIDCLSQINENLVADFYLYVPGSSGNPLVVTKNQTYYFEPLSRNVCTFNSFTYYFTRTDGVVATGITINGEANNSSAGNGGIGVTRPPVKFSLPGTYNVKLRVIRAFKPQASEICTQQSDEEYKQGYIYVPYDLPIAAFNSNGSQSNKTVQAGTTVTFTPLTGVAYNYPTNFIWKTSLNNNVYQDKTLSLQFNETGTYTVTLSSFNPAGQSSPITYTISVTPKAPATDFLANGSSSGISAVQNAVVSLTDISLYQPTSWLWTITGNPVFASNTSNTSQNPSVSFGQIGPVNVTLKATNTGGPTSKTKNSFITVLPQPPNVVTPVTYCAGAAPIPLTTTNGTSLKWYTSITGGTASATAPTPSTATPGLTYYYVSQTVGGYESPRQPIAVQINPLPSMPAVTASIVHCTASVAPALKAAGNNLKWYTVASGGTGSATAIIPNTSTAGIKNYYVSQTDANACESFRSAIVVNVINTLPLPSAISPVNYCLDGEAFPVGASPTLGSDIKWYNTLTGTAALNEAPTPVTSTTGTVSYYAAQTHPGCAEGPRAQIQVVTNNISSPVSPTVVTPVIYNQSQDGNLLEAVGSNLKWYTTATGGAASNFAPVPLTGLVGTNSYYVTQTVSGCESRRAQIEVVIKPGVPVAPPTWSAVFKLPTDGAANPFISRGANMTAENGETYVTKAFNGTVNFGLDLNGNPVNLTALGATDFYLAKYNSAGRVVWIKKAGGPGSGHSAEGIALVKAGTGIFITGMFYGSVTFGSTTLVSNQTFNAAMPDIFVAQYDTSGAIIWAKKAGGKLNDIPYGISVSAAGIFVTGQIGISGEVETSASFGNLNSPTNQRIFIAKYDFFGNPVWVSGTQNKQFDYGIAIGTDAAGNSTITADGIVLNYDNNGLLVWKKLLSRYDAKAKTTYFATGYAVLADKDGNIFIAGKFTGSINFDADNSLTSAGDYDAFLVKYDKTGKVIWARKGGGIGLDEAVSLDIDDYGNIYMAGTFYQTATFGGQALTAPNTSLFIVKYGPQGNEIWAKQSVCRPRAIKVDQQGTLYVEGVGANITFDAVTPVFSGSYFLATIGGNITSPTILSLQPASAFPGEKINIVGKGLLNTSAVLFNSIASDDYKVNTINNVEARVPQQATSGKVKLATPAGSDSADFSIKAYNDEDFPSPLWRWANLTSNTTGTANTQVVADVHGYTYLLEANSLSKFDSLGHFIWQSNLQGSLFFAPQKIELDIEGKIVFGGFLSGGAMGSFTVGNNTLTGSGHCIARIDTSGSVLSIVKTSGVGAIAVGGISTDRVIEYFNVPGTHIKTISLIAYSSNNIRLWEKQIGSYEDYFDRYNIYVVKLINDNEGNSYVIGNYNGVVEIGGKIMESNDDAYFKQVFVAKFDKDGNTLWVRRILKSTYQSSYWSGGDDVRDIQLDNDGNVYIMGMFYGTVEFGNKILKTNRNDGWITKFDAFGNRIWAMSMKSASGAESRPQSIFAFGKDKLVVSGNIFNGQVVFSDTSLQTGPDVSTTFVAQLLPPAPPPSIVDFSPKQGARGTTVEIDGSKFLGTFEVRFNGTATTDFSISSSKKIMAKVPDNAATGTIVVTTPNGVARATAEFLITGKDSGAVQLCPGSTAIINSSIQGSNCQWQVDMGKGFVNLTDTSQYADFTTTTLIIKKALSNMYGFKYRCIVNGTTSNTTLLKFVSYWAGSSNDNWDTGGNWGCANKIPDINTDVYIPSGNVVIRSNVLVRSLTLSPAATLTIEPGYTLDVIKQ